MDIILLKPFWAKELKQPLFFARWSAMMSMTASRRGGTLGGSGGDLSTERPPPFSWLPCGVMGYRIWFMLTAAPYSALPTPKNAPPSRGVSFVELTDRSDTGTIMNAKMMIEAFQCPGCLNGDNTRCGSFKLHELTVRQSKEDGQQLATPFRCQNHTASEHLGAYVNMGLPIPFARVQYRDTREEVRTNIRLHISPPAQGVRLWDVFNVPVWALEKWGYLFVRTYNPRTDQSYVDVIQDGNFDKLLKDTPCINIESIQDTIDL